jgi:uncharacterized membrane protein YeaQ/YmgE (transglycosylase-associated protein family)
MRGTRWKRSALLNILSGITDADLAGVFLTSQINTEVRNDGYIRSGITSGALLISLFGAIILVAVTNVFRHFYE